MAHLSEITEETTLPTEDLRVLFDAAVSSLDFASGFLDNDEVLALRRIAVVLGVDPLKATPYNFNMVVATCEHDWEYADRTWHVKPGVTVRWHEREVNDPAEELEWTKGSGDITVLNQLARHGSVVGPEHQWYRRCRECGTHEDEDRGIQ